MKTLQEVRDQLRKWDRCWPGNINIERAVDDAIIALDKCDAEAEESMKEIHSLRSDLDTLEAEVARLREDRDRIGRNRDMWKGQCERQAEQLSASRPQAGEDVK